MAAPTQDSVIRHALRMLAALTFHLRPEPGEGDSEEYLRGLTRWGCGVHTQLTEGTTAVIVEQVRRHVPPGAAVLIGGEAYRMPDEEGSLNDDPTSRSDDPEGRDELARELLRDLPEALGWNWGGPDWKLVEKLSQSEITTRERFVTDSELRKLFVRFALDLSEVRSLGDLKPILDKFEPEMLAA